MQLGLWHLGWRFVRLVVEVAAGAISKSNNRNIIATRKNFIENGSRAEFIGSNPIHKGLLFLYINLDEALRRLLKLEL